MQKLKTYSAKPADITRKWYLVDASEAALGRVATLVASRLMGKHKATYTPHLDCGDGVIIINAAKLKFTGNKLIQKRYFRHSGYPGALRSDTAEQLLAKNPIKVVEAAVKGMLPKNKLQAGWLKRLKVYRDDKHDQTAQQPEKLEVKRG